MLHLRLVFVRNGMSATFMNLSDAVPLKDIEMGAKWAAAQVDTKGRTLAGNTYNNWMERAGVKIWTRLILL